jgi:hypothetical protein
MNVENLIVPIEKPFLKQFERWSEDTLTLTLLGLAAFIVFIALQKDKAILKAVLLTWILLP